MCVHVCVCACEWMNEGKIQWMNEGKRQCLAGHSWVSNQVRKDKRARKVGLIGGREGETQGRRERRRDGRECVHGKFEVD